MLMLSATDRRQLFGLVQLLLIKYSQFIAGYLQSILYAVLIRAGDPKPAPGSPRHARDLRRLQIFIIGLYLVYTIYDADLALRQGGDFYQILGVAHDATDKTIMSKFRRLQIQFHPDKVTDPDKAAVDASFVRLSVARDTLIDPVKRFAYDRFGPRILDQESNKTIHDFVMSGVQTAGLAYVGAAVGLLFASWLGYMRKARFWRYLILAAVFAIEVRTSTRPDFPPWLSTIINPVLVSTGLRAPYLPFQMVLLLQKLGITFTIGLSQLEPLLQDPQQATVPGQDALSPQSLDRLNYLVRATDEEIARNTALELAPFAQEESMMRELKVGVKEWLVQNQIRSDPAVDQAMKAVRKRRQAERTGEGETQIGMG